MARSRSKPRRRSNGVGAYHMYLGRLLKAANLKGKSKTARAAAFKKAVAQARAQAKKGFSASARAGVSEANKRISAKKAAGRSRRGGMKKAAYKALSPAERRRVRAGKAASASASKVAASRRRASASRKAASKRPASIRAASAKGTRVVTTKKGKKMYYVNGKLVSKATYEAAVGRAASAPKAASRKRRKAASKAAPKAASRKAVSRKAKGASKRKAGSKRKGMRRRKNTGLATVFDGVKQFGTEALTWQGIGGAAVVGVAHGIVAPMVAGYLADMFPQTFKVPVLDVDVTAASFSFTATGLVAGAALAGLGYATGRPVLGLGLGALAFSSGVVIDTVGLVQTRQAALEGGSDEAVASLGDVAYGAIDNQGMVYGDVAYGDVAYGEMYNAGQTYGDVAYGAVMGEAGMDYGTMCASEYADAEAADAEESGADFSEEEGQALMDGPLAWLRRFGRPPRRMTGIRGRKSRHAGRAGHRWGWLIKLVGMNKAAAIASLPPEKRLKVISALRKQAIESLSALMAEQTSATTTEATMAAANERVPAHLLLPPPPMRPNLLPPAQAMGLDLMATGAGGAMGAGGYGAVMYAGSGF